MTDHAAIRRHLARCTPCRWLTQHALRTRDPVIVEAALRLRADHLAADEEREAFLRRPAQHTPQGRIDR